MGARLGAIVDVLPAERFRKPDRPDAEMGTCAPGRRGRWGLDDYADVTDPVWIDSGQRHPRR